MRIVFIIRSAPDIERFCAIAAHLDNEELLLVDVGAASPPHPDLHLYLLRHQGVSSQKWWKLLGLGSAPRRAASLQDARRLLELTAPDLLVLDQFGPSCPKAVVDCRDAALELGVTCCMIPHGVQVLAPITGPPRPAERATPADVVFFTSWAHWEQAAWYYGRPGVRCAVLGDPRFDLNHLRRLQAAAAAEGEDLTPVNSVAYFGSRLPADVATRLNHPVASSPEAEFLSKLRSHWSEVLHRPHPREMSPTAPVESIVLSTKVAAAACLASSAVLEAVALGKPAVVLDIEAITPECRSIFTAYSTGWAPDSPLPLRLVDERGEELLRRYAWGEAAPDRVASTYAECLKSIAGGQDHPALFVRSPRPKG